FNSLSAQSPFTISAMQARSRCPSWRQVFKPCALGLFGLGIAVALWGFGYKLSLYNRHAAPSSRASVARLWIEPRDASFVATSRLKARSRLIPGPLALSVPIQQFLRIDHAVS